MRHLFKEAQQPILWLLVRSYKMYKQFISPEGTVSSSIIRVSDMACIPNNPDNTDYQEYLEWVGEGNEPAPPNEPETP